MTGKEEMIKMAMEHIEAPKTDIAEMIKRKDKPLPASLQKIVDRVQEVFAGDPAMVELFINCFTNTLDTTVKAMPDGTTHVITGDIPAMWLRDSTAQVRPYLLAAKEDKEIADLLVGLSHRQFFFINHDAYANAFNQEENGNRWDNDETEMTDWIWERKYEVDSLCYPLQFAYLLWKNTGREDQFDAQFVNGVKRILEVWRLEQNHEENSRYRFTRKDAPFHDGLSRNGMGPLVKGGIGMTWSGFRPSDDSCVYGYLVPSNMFATVVLGYAAEIAREVLENEALAVEALTLRDEIHDSIETYGKIFSWRTGHVYAYEVDGFGQAFLMDDANVPSLLSMKYLGYDADPEAYANTRKLILSEANPYYYEGTCAKGIGSQHTPPRYVWHISLAMQGLTSETKEEKLAILQTMRDTTAGKEVMHEGFDVSDPAKFTREWFSWANAMFCELCMDYCDLRVEK